MKKHMLLALIVGASLVGAQTYGEIKTKIKNETDSQWPRIKKKPLGWAPT